MSLGILTWPIQNLFSRIGKDKKISTTNTSEKYHLVLHQCFQIFQFCLRYQISRQLELRVYFTNSVVSGEIRQETFVLEKSISTSNKPQIIGIQACI